MVSLADVENAFQPSKAIGDTNRFSGRSVELKNAFRALMSDGTNIAIIGNRGIGKTSLAQQVLNFSTGDSALINKINGGVSHKFNYYAIYITCESSIDGFAGLLERLLSSDAGLSKWLPIRPKAEKVTHSANPNFKVKVVAVEAGLGTNHSTETVSENVTISQNIVSVFENAVRNLLDSQKNEGILFIIDEFDQIKNTNGFGGFLKSISANVNRVKFCIVGVAKNIKELIEEHQSVDRLFAGGVIALPPMNDEELLSIINIAEGIIKNQIIFSDDAKKLIVNLAQGHPYLVHLIGKFSLRYAYDNKLSEIDQEVVQRTIKIIAENNHDPVLEGKYRKAVASSSQREIVLKALANSVDNIGEVLTTNAYRVAYEQGVENPSQYVGQLVLEEYGAEIEKLRERYYRFKDSLFSSYVRAHPAIIPINSDGGG